MFKASIQLYRNAYSGLSPQIWWLSAVIFVNRSGTMVIPFLTVYLLSRGFTLTEAGYVMGAFGVGTIVGGYLGGKLTDRYHFHQVQFYSLLLNGILFIVLGEMKTFTQLAVCIFVLSSLGEAFRPANAAAIAAYSNESNRTRCYSLNRLAINLGWSVGPAIGGVLASINYKLLFWADGITCMVASLLLQIFLKPSGVQSKPKIDSAKEFGKSALKDRVFMLGMFYLFLVGFCFFQLFSILPLFYKSVVHLDEMVIGWLLAMNGLIIVAVEMILVYKLESRSNIYKYMLLGCVLIGVSFALLNMNTAMPVLVLNIITVTFGEMLLFPFINNFWVKRSADHNRGEYAAVFTISFAVATVLAPTVASQVASHAGFATLWWINFILCAIAGVGFLSLKSMSHE